MKNIAELTTKTHYKHSVECTVANVKTTVYSDDQVAIESFSSYLPIRVEDMMPVEYCCDVYYLCDVEAQQSIRAMAEKGGEPYWIKPDVCFQCFESDGYTVYMSDIDEITKMDYSIVAKEDKYWVVCEHMNEMISRVAVRLQREILLRHLENRGACFVHAAAVSDRGSKKGFLIIGDSGAGKSTTAWQLCRLMQFDYISNDKTIVLDYEDNLNAICWPLAARLGVGTLQSSGKLEEYKSRKHTREQENFLWDQRVNNSEQKKKNWANKVKLSLTCRELLDYEGIESTSSCILSGIIVPQLSIGSGELSAIKVDLNKHIDLIARNILEPFDEDIGRGWLGIRNVSDEFLINCKNKLLTRFSDIPVFELSGDPQQFEQSIDRVTATLVENYS